MSDDNGAAKFVESVIDGMVESDLDVGDAVAQILDESKVPETVEIDESALEEGDISCPACGNEELDYGVVETEDGELPVIHCPACDTGLVPDLGEDEEEDDEGEEVMEAELDEDSPECPVCGSDDLAGEVIEDDDGDEFQLITCNGCGAGMVPADEED